ncbi:MAG: D-2-hydroxyacid dehydrogenase [Pseudomonadota bacterium]
MADLPKVLLHNDQTEPLAADLSERFPDIRFRECNTYEDVPTILEGFRPEIVYTVRFNGTPAYPRDALFENDSVKWISNGGAGTDHFGIWDPSKVIVTNSAGVAADMMAEYVIGGFLHFTLDVPGFQSDQRQKIWRDRMVRPLKGKTLLIVGLGSTGRALAKRAKAFGMHVIGTRANPQAMENVDRVAASDALAELLPKADFVAVSTPLTNKTRNLMDHASFARMKNGVVLADVSRGHVILESALIEALENGTVGAAVLDVFEEEPLPRDNPLWGFENVLISPHCSSVYEGWDEASFHLFLGNLERWIKGEDLNNVVDPERGY